MPVCPTDHFCRDPKMGLLDFGLRLAGFLVSLFFYSYLELIGGKDYDLPRYNGKTDNHNHKRVVKCYEFIKMVRRKHFF